MHPNLASLLAFCDGEAGADRSLRIARHLSQCEGCSNQLRRIRSEKDELSAGAAMPVMESRQGLAGVLSAIENWRRNPGGVGASELRSRLRWQIEAYFGSPAVLAVERPGIPAEEMLGKTSELLDVFLGPAAAEAVREDVLSGLDSARREDCR
jgi:anti-sigma factor RsiW